MAASSWSLVAHTVRLLSVLSADRLPVCNAVSRWYCVGVSFYYFLCSCILCRWWHSGFTFDSFILRLPSFDCWVPLVTPRWVCLVLRQDMVQSGDSFRRLWKTGQRSPVGLFFKSLPKKYDMGNEATYNARIGLINETRRNPPTIYFFCGLSLNTVKSRRCDFRGKQEKNISFENRYHPDVDQNPIKNENKAWFLHSRFICLVRHDRKSWLLIAQYSFLHVNRQACFKTMKVCSGGSLYIDVSDIAP